MNRRDFLIKGFLATTALTLLPRPDAGDAVEADFAETVAVADMPPRGVVKILYPTEHSVDGLSSADLLVQNGANQDTYPIRQTNGRLTKAFRSLLGHAPNGEPLNVPELHQASVETFQHAKTFRLATEPTTLYEVPFERLMPFLAEAELREAYASQLQEMTDIWQNTPENFLRDEAHIVIDMRRDQPVFTFGDDERPAALELIRAVERHAVASYAHRASTIAADAGYGSFTLPPHIIVSAGPDQWQSTITADLDNAVILHTPVEMLPQAARPATFFENVETAFTRYVERSYQLRTLSPGTP